MLCFEVAVDRTCEEVDGAVEEKKELMPSSS